MSNYKLTVQYDGTRYRGWQRLGDAENTIQLKLENVLTLFAGEPVQINGSGRTDAGAHAIAQSANFKLKSNPPAKEIKEYMNRYLPDDISVVNVEWMPERFHARFNVQSKTYLYKIWNQEHPNPFMRKYSMHVPEKLDLGLMKKAAQYFIGTHDFTAFSNARSKSKSTVRTVTSIEFEGKDGFVDIRVTGDGFLHNQVRKMVGHLIGVGNYLFKGEEISDIIASKDRSRVQMMADACGLYLEEVSFPSDKD